ncbi:MAG: hypothetical protein ACREGR_04740, partial [Minisyncoccia bacterium]
GFSSRTPLENFVAKSSSPDDRAAITIQPIMWIGWRKEPDWINPPPHPRGIKMRRSTVIDRREMRQTEEQEQEQEEQKSRRTMIIWEDEEKEDLAKEIIRIRRDIPELGFIELANRAQRAKLPLERQRKLPHVKSVTCLLDVVRRLDRQINTTAEEVAAARETIRQVIAQNQALQHQCSVLPSTREDIIKGLDEDEILTRFTRLVLDNLSATEIAAHFSPEELLSVIPMPKVAAFLAENVVSLMEGGTSSTLDILSHLTQPHSNGHARHPTLNGDTHKPKLPRVLVVGPKAEQGILIQKRLIGRCDVTFVDKNRKTQIPSGYDCYVVWTRFCSHAIQAVVEKAAGCKDKVLLHHGGLDRMAVRVLDFLAG